MRQRILNPEQLYSAYQLGLVLRLSADTIRKMARKHEIPYVMVGGRMQFCGWQIKKLDAAEYGAAGRKDLLKKEGGLDEA